ncbi:MAG: hypothetical protein K0S28_924 [Paucimonas sp.]|jgi:hyperosmotically inducible protein|nr:hypothetical protein [Paucimonas sp.]
MMKLKLMLSAVFAFLLVACAGSPTDRSTGVALDDAAITTKVKQRIAADAGVGTAATVNVDTYRGVVSLAGFVDSAEQAVNAGQAASQVAGVERVVNNLQIKAPQVSTGSGSQPSASGQ